MGGHWIIYQSIESMHCIGSLLANNNGDPGHIETPVPQEMYMDSFI